MGNHGGGGVAIRAMFPFRLCPETCNAAFCGRPAVCGLASAGGSPYHRRVTARTRAPEAALPTHRATPTGTTAPARLRA